MKRILFVCVENSCRSQMAEAMFNCRVDARQAKAWSAGSRPSGSVNANAVEMMREKGLDISAARSKGFDALPIKNFDYVITLGCKDVCPFVPAKEHIEWQIPDPKGRDRDFFRKACAIIEEKIEAFIRENLGNS